VEGIAEENMKIVVWSIAGFVAGLMLTLFLGAIKALIIGCVVFGVSKLFGRRKKIKVAKFSKTRGLDPHKYESIKDRFYV
jgi:hypothetical protein